jgi:hypothetical protein
VSTLTDRSLERKCKTMNPYYPYPYIDRKE